MPVFSSAAAAGAAIAAIGTGAQIEGAQHQRRLSGQAVDRQNAAHGEARRDQQAELKSRKADEANQAARASLLRSQRKAAGKVQGRQGTIQGGKSTLGA
jgi:hypothetical protein